MGCPSFTIFETSLLDFQMRTTALSGNELTRCSCTYGSRTKLNQPTYNGWISKQLYHLLPHDRNLWLQRFPSRTHERVQRLFQRPPFAFQGRSRSVIVLTYIIYSSISKRELRSVKLVPEAGNFPKTSPISRYGDALFLSILQ